MTGDLCCYLGPALVTARDAGDAITLLQSLAGSTFDSSQLVLTACMGYQSVTEKRLQALRNKHRPEVLIAMEERAQGLAAKDSKFLASKLYSFKHDSVSLLPETNLKEVGETHTNGDLDSGKENFDGYFNGQMADSEPDSLPDLQEQVIFLIAVSYMLFHLPFRELQGNGYAMKQWECICHCLMHAVQMLL